MINKVGRPKLGTQNAKGIVLSARFSPGEVRTIKDAIRRDKTSKSDWIRKALLAAAVGGKNGS